MKRYRSLIALILAATLVTALPDPGIFAAPARPEETDSTGTVNITPEEEPELVDITHREESEEVNITQSATNTTVEESDSTANEVNITQESNPDSLVNITQEDEVDITEVTDENDENFVFGTGDIHSEMDDNIPAIPDDVSYSEAMESAEAIGCGGEDVTGSVEDEIPAAYPTTYTDREGLLDYFDTQLPPLRSQGSEGTCWAHSIIGNIETYMLRHNMADRAGLHTNKDINYSELHTAYFTHNTIVNPINGQADAVGINGKNSKGELYHSFNIGSNFHYAAEAMSAWVGPASENLLSYSLTSDENLRNDRSALGRDYVSYEDQVHFKSYVDINLTENRDQAKQAIRDSGSVSVSFYSYQKSSNPSYYAKVYSEENNAYYNYNPAGLTVNNGRITTNHAVMIVGWDDNFPKENFADASNPPKGDGAWLIRNSWTDELKNPDAETLDYKAYFWLSYYDLSLSDARCIEVRPADDHDNNYYYTAPFYLNSAYDMDKFANVFTAGGVSGSSKELLKSVTFLAYDAEIDYTIDVYKDIPEGEGPEKGTRVAAASTSGKTYFQGMYTVELSSPVELDRGERFAVVITGGRISHEKDYGSPTGNGQYSVVSINPGESYYYYKGTWKDFYTLGSDHGNFCINALTCDVDESDRVKGIRQENVTENSATVAWNALTGATGYQVMRATTLVGGDSFTLVDTLGAGSLSYEDTGLESEKTYYYMVIPVVSDGAKRDRRSQKIAVTTLPGAITDVPEIYKGTFNSEPAFYIAKSGYDGCVYEYSTDGENFIEASVSHTDDYSVVYKSALPSDAKALKACYFKRLEGGSRLTGDFCSPIVLYPAPQNLTGSYKDGKISLSWNKVEGASCYSVFRDGTMIGDTKWNKDNFYSDSNVTEGETYEYTVCAHGTSMTGGLIESFHSEPVSVYAGAGHFITFDSMGGTAVASEYIRAGSTVTKPSDPEKKGYSLEGWCSDPECETLWDFATLPETDMKLYAKWVAATDTPYVVKHFKQTVDGTGYLLADTDRLKGTTDSIVIPDTKSYTGFKTPVKTSINIDGDGQTVLEYKYERCKYKVTVLHDDTIKSVTGGGTYYYEAPVSITVIAAEGYEPNGFVGTVNTGSFLMPAEDVMIVAKAKLKSSSGGDDTSSSSDKTTTSSGKTTSSSGKGSTSTSSYSGSSSEKKQPESISINNVVTAADGAIYHITCDDSVFFFTGKKIVPPLEVRDSQGNLLRIKKDYKITCKNNKNADCSFDHETGDYNLQPGTKQPVYTIKFIKAYKRSKSIKGTFNICAHDISDATVLPKKDVITAKTGKKVKFLKSVTVMLNGKKKKLNLKKDIVPAMIYMVNMETGQPFTVNSSASAPEGRYFIYIKGKGNYSGVNNSAEFTLTRS